MGIDSLLDFDNVKSEDSFSFVWPSSKPHWSRHSVDSAKDLQPVTEKVNAKRSLFTSTPVETPEPPRLSPVPEWNPDQFEDIFKPDVGAELRSLEGQAKPLENLQIDVWSGGKDGRKVQHGLGDLLNATRKSTSENNDLKSESGDVSLSEIAPRYKTELCRNFKEKKFCAYGAECQFAHGEQDLRDVGRQHRYKTRKCQSYWIKGCCVYGARCNFIHATSDNSTNSTPSTDGQGKQVIGVVGGAVIGTRGVAVPAKSDLIIPVHGSGRMGMYLVNDKIRWIDTYTRESVQEFHILLN